MGIGDLITKVKQRFRYRVRWRRVALIAGPVTGLAVLIFLASLIGFVRGIHSEFAAADAGVVQKPLPGRRINILIMGLDKPENGLKTVVDVRTGVNRSDVLILASFDPKTKGIGFLSIPRDTLVNIPGYRSDKINAAHAYGQAEKQPRGPALAIQTVKAFLDVDINYYVRTNVDGFSRIVDLLGGVTIDVPKDMNYDDPVQNLHIHLKKGRQRLNGEKAMEFVRYRGAMGDIGRIEDQQIFVKAVLKRLLNPLIVFRLPTLSRELSKLVDTNMGTGTMFRVATMAVFHRSRVQTGTVPGVGQDIGGGNYWVPDMAGTRALVDKLVRGIDRQATAKVKVEVLNGTKVAGLATKMAGKLQGLGYDVVKIDSADRPDYTYTRVIRRGGDEKAFSQLAETVKGWAPSAKFSQAQAGTAGSAVVSIIVGPDFK